MTMLAKQIAAVSLAVAAVMAAHASSAFAAADWTIEGLTLGELGLTEEAIAGGGGEFRLEAAGVTIKCEKGEVTGKLLPGGTGEAKFSLTKCKANATCSIGETLTLDTKFEPVAESGIIRQKFSQRTGFVIATIVFGGMECALAGGQPVTGTMRAATSPTDLVEQPWAFPGGVSALKVGANTATLTGAVNVALAGAEAGKPWFQFIAQHFYDLSLLPKIMNFGGVGVTKKFIIRNTGTWAQEIANIVVNPAANFVLTDKNKCLKKTLEPAGKAGSTCIIDNVECKAKLPEKAVGELRVSGANGPLEWSELFC